MDSGKSKRKLSSQTIAFRAQVYKIVRAIPPGRVMTYGAIASLIPPPRGMDMHAFESIKARWVGYAMADCPEEVPWQRVVNAKGQVSRRPGLDLPYQRHLLEAEGVIFDVAGCVDLDHYGWAPGRHRVASRSPLITPPLTRSPTQRSGGQSRSSRTRKKGHR